MIRAGENILEVRDLKKYFPITKGIITRRKVGDVKAVDGLSFDVRKGETLGLVGESGCGKSTTGRTLMRLYEPTAGRIIYDGTDLATLKDRELKPWRRKLQIIFQDPYASLNPRMTVGNIISEAMIYHGVVPASERDNRVRELLELVGLRSYFSKRFPHDPPLPARILRRSAPAHRYCPGPGPGTGVHRLRRAHQRPGRLHSGPGGQPSGGSAGETGPDLPVHRP